MSFGLHLHDGELQKAAKYLVELQVAGINWAYAKCTESCSTEGIIRKSERRYQRAEKKLAGFSMNLNKAERDELDNCFQM
jgi:hypothetical protein